MNKWCRHLTKWINVWSLIKQHYCIKQFRRMRTIEEVGIKFYIYQLIGVLVVWLEMTYFIDYIGGDMKIIYYIVTSWMLFIIVLTIKKYFSDRKKKDD